MRTLLLLPMLAACGPDLPDGWEGARPVADLEQAPCGGTPYEEYDERVASDLTGDPLVVEVFESPFRCEQDVSGFWKRSGDRLDVLVQPTDMSPRVVAGCDCLYDLVIEVTTTAEPPTEVTVHRRQDDLNDDNEPVLIGTIVLGPEGPVP